MVALLLLMPTALSITNLLPNSCADSDGDCSVDNIRDLDDVYEAVDLNTNPFGWVEALSFTNSIPQHHTIDSAFIHVYWKTDTQLGASGISIDYWNGSWQNCAGPYSESEVITDTSCNISFLSKDQLSNVKVRFRGQDTDGFPNAFAYIDLVKIEANHSAPPIFSTAYYPEMIFNGDEANISVQVYDDVGLSYAILSTNETGKWVNYTGIYGSPVYFNGEADQWLWANFSWRNTSFLSGVVGWKIYLIDSTGKQNVTEGSFFVQYKRKPLSCIDSDGDCNVENIKEKDGTFELLDLLTSPFGWLEVSSWDSNITEEVLFQSIKLVVEWKTDVLFGADDINVDYWVGSWQNCAGPYSESDTLQQTVCYLNLSVSDFNSLKVRFRGQDTDGFPNAFAYIDDIYILANFTEIEKNYLIVELAKPKTLTYVAQNYTFIVNATVFCQGGGCGNVSGTVRYNSSSSDPDAPISEVEATPLYIIDGSATKQCPTNPLDGLDEYCNLTWTINATGPIGSGWKIGVLFNSTNNNTAANHTSNESIEIQECIVDITLSFSTIDFGEILPNSYGNPATGNNENAYNITTNPGSCNLDLWIKGTDLVGSSNIYVGNISWSKINNAGSAQRLSYDFMLLQSNSPALSTITTYYWLDMIPTFAGKYTGNITIMANKTSG
jgi:hypothetical protein